MNDILLLARARALVTELHHHQRDARTRRTLGFLRRKGFLITSQSYPFSKKPLSVNDCLWVAKNVEPRVLEVLPAAILRFPRSFQGLSFAPQPLKEVLASLQRGEEGPPLFAVPFNTIRRWVDFPLPDKRTVTPSKKRRLKTFRFTPHTIASLKNLARARNLSETALIEELILGAATALPPTREVHKS